VRRNHYAGGLPGSMVGLRFFAALTASRDGLISAEAGQGKGEAGEIAVIGQALRGSRPPICCTGILTSPCTRPTTTWAGTPIP